MRAEPSAQTRQLGRTHAYGAADLPARLRHWHAPRANRWERVCVEAGTLRVAWLGDEGATGEMLTAGDARWIAPGVRWQVTQIDATTRFSLEIHADDATAAAAPLPLRAALLDDAACVGVDHEDQFTQLLATLPPGTRRLVRGSFDFGDALRKAMSAGDNAWCWHPLQASAGQHVALIARSAQPIGLLEYLGRDHAAIEAALSGALRGERERMHWLRTLLHRHLAIEEDLLFPAYLAAGGHAGWVRGLCSEHQHLRHHLERLDDAQSRRRFLLLLDGHDEKEEQIVYPDIALRLGGGLDGLYRQVMNLGVGDTVAATA